MWNTDQRRSNARTPFACFAKFWRNDTDISAPVWLCVTRDFSHEGVYFLADDHDLREHTRLVLSFAYNQSQQMRQREYLVEVVRVQKFNSPIQTRCGIGAKLIITPSSSRAGRIVAPELALSPAIEIADSTRRLDLRV